MRDKLTPKQKAFCEFYAASGNAAEAAIKAGYKEDTARFVGAQNLTKLNIRDYLQELAQKSEEARFMQIEERRAKLAEIARQDVAYETSFGIRSNAADIIKAIDTLNKRDGLYLQRVEVGGELRNPFASLTEEQLARLAGE